MNLDTILFVAAVFIGFPSCIAFGIFLGIRVCRRNLDGQIAKSLIKQMPMVQHIERTARTSVVDAKARRIQRRQGSAAFCDVLVMGKEITMVGADRELLEDFAGSIKLNQQAIDAAIAVKHDLRARGPQGGSEPAAPKPPAAAPELRVLDGGKVS